jgi:V8-like Glu-specific endopeptidase
VITSPGATFVRVHFTGFSLAKGDHVTVSSPDGARSFRYEGRGPNDDGDFWAFAIDGETAIVELHSRTGGGHGFSIGDIGHGTLALTPRVVSAGGVTPRNISLAAPTRRGTPEAVCATDGREDIACHPELDEQQEPVARLLFTRDDGMFVCTGWLVDGKYKSTLITNNHCISAQSEANTLETRFNYQRAECDRPEMATHESYSGGTLLKTNSQRRSGSSGGLDYTLIALPDHPERRVSPEETWGELVATTRAPRVGDVINIVQHPGGGPKEVGYWRDAAQTLRCQVDTRNQTYYLTASRTQVGYSCDTAGGSSGSPVVHGVSGKVVALHHLGNVGLFTCRNGGTQMSAICADAGDLLDCASD